MYYWRTIESFLLIGIGTAIIVLLCVMAAQQSYQWEQCPTDSDWIGLRKDGLQIGAYSLSHRVYRPYFRNSDEFGLPCEIPADAPALPCKCSADCPCDGDSCLCASGKEPCSTGCRCLLHRNPKPAIDPRKYPGVITDQLGKSSPYAVNGRPVRREEAVKRLASTIPDDRHKLSLSFIGGTEEDRAKAVEAAKAAGLDGQCLIQSYKADNPLVANTGFVTTGAPSVYLQRPDGLVLLRAENAGPATIEALRKKVANYDPAKDPKGDVDLSLNLADLPKLLDGLPAWAWALMGGGAVLLFSRQKVSSK